MKKVLCVCCILFPALFTFAETITIVADQWAPVNGDPESSMPGYVVEFAEKIFTAAGYEFEYRIIPWSRALHGVKNGVYTSVIGATTQNAEDLLLPTEPFGILENDFYTRADGDWSYNGPASLEHQRLGTIADYAYGEIQDFIDSHKHTKKVQEVGGETPLVSNFNKLFARRITVLVEWGPVAEYTAREHGWSDQIRHAGRGGNEIPLYLGFRKGRDDLATIWDEGIAKLKSDGRLEAILNKYGLTQSGIGINQ